MKKLGDVTDQDFEKVVLESDLPVMIDFWADWCMPCHAIAPTVDDIAGERSDIRVFKLNIDENKDTTLKYKVMSVPTLIFFKNGEEVNRVIGIKSKESLIEIIDSL